MESWISCQNLKKQHSARLFSGKWNSFACRILVTASAENLIPCLVWPKDPQKFSVFCLDILSSKDGRILRPLPRYPTFVAVAKHALRIHWSVLFLRTHVTQNHYIMTEELGFLIPYPRISKSEVLRNSYVIKNRENRKGKRNPHLSHKKQAYNWLVFFLLELQIGYRHYSQQKTWTNICVHSAFGSFSLGLPFLGFMKQKQEQHGNWKRNFIALFLVPKHPIVQNLFWLLSRQVLCLYKKNSFGFHSHRFRKADARLPSTSCKDWFRFHREEKDDSFSKVVGHNVFSIR